MITIYDMVTGEFERLGQSPKAPTTACPGGDFALEARLAPRAMEFDAVSAGLTQRQLDVLELEALIRWIDED